MMKAASSSEISVDLDRKEIFAVHGSKQVDIDKHLELSLPQHSSYLLERLQCEKRRADRSKAPLSIAIFRYNNKPGELGNLEILIGVLQRRIRETDILGYLREDTIVILLPDTDEKGLQNFIGRIIEGYQDSYFSIIIETYPSQPSHDFLTKESRPDTTTLIEQALEESSRKKLKKPWHSTSSLQIDPASKLYFLERLRYEKRRTDRSNTSLSIMFFDFSSHNQDEKAEHFRILLDRLKKNLREIDILGYPGENLIGILLLDTDKKGAQDFIKKIIGFSKEKLSFLVTTETYPDQIFDNFLAENQKLIKTRLILLDESIKVNRFEYRSKRMLDILGALLGIILFSPLMVITALAIKATSPGPVIFKQVRVGRRGMPFVFYKFRSMFCNTDDRIHREYTADLIKGNHQNINHGDEELPLYKIKTDPRVTPVGRIIRRTSIDELPQLFNVLKGEMSLVGPRPPLPYEAERYQSWHLRRVLEVKPGITGLWQVKERSKVPFDEMVRLDLKYIQKCSLRLDIKLLLKTIKVVLRSPGAC